MDIKSDRIYKNLGEPVLERPQETSVLGDGGVSVDGKKLFKGSQTNLQAMEDSISKYSINQHLSEQISLHRTIKDRRHKLCWKRDPFDYPNLPTATVVITFFNEGRSTLLRTIYSVLHSSPKALLKEIILIDDFSDRPHLKGQLEDDLRDLPRVRLIRTREREGLVRARLLGASKAKGKNL